MSSENDFPQQVTAADLAWGEAIAEAWHREDHYYGNHEDAAVMRKLLAALRALAAAAPCSCVECADRCPHCKAGKSITYRENGAADCDFCGYQTPPNACTAPVAPVVKEPQEPYAWEVAPVTGKAVPWLVYTAEEAAWWRSRPMYRVRELHTHPAPVAAPSAWETEAMQAVREVVRRAWQVADSTEDSGEDVRTTPADVCEGLCDALDALEDLIPESEHPATAGHVVTLLMGRVRFAVPPAPPVVHQEGTKALLEIASVLDKAAGDSDVMHHATDEEMREHAPVQWAIQRLFQLAAGPDAEVTHG